MRAAVSGALNFYDASVERGEYAWSDLLAYVLSVAPVAAPFADLRARGTTQIWTHDDVVAAALEVADHLRSQGILPGDRVGILSESRPEFLAHFLGVGLAGACFVPVDPKLASPEMARLLEHSGALRLFHSEGLAPIAERLVKGGLTLKVEPFLARTDVPGPRGFLLAELRRARVPRPISTPLILLYTSGTSGEPKGVLLSVDNVLFGVQDALRAFPPKPAHYLSILPMNHVFEMIGGCLRPFVSLSRVTYVESAQSPELITLLRSHGIDTMLVVPAFLTMLRKRVSREIERDPRGARLWRALGVLKRLGAPRRLRKRLARPLRAFGPDLIRFAVGGAPTDPETREFFERLGIHVLQGYGLSETTAATCLSHEEHYRAGASGRALPGVELRVDEPNADGEGELCVRGRAVMLGYYRRPDLTAEVLSKDGWFRTGDLGRIDRQGFVWIKGRVRNLIVLASGKKVVPEEVEEWLLRQPEVAEACVLGVAGANRMDQKVWAVVTPAEAFWRGLGKESPDEEVSRELTARLRSREAAELSDFKIPAHYVVRAEPLPKTTTLKVRRIELARQLPAGI